MLSGEDVTEEAVKEVVAKLNETLASVEPFVFTLTGVECRSSRMRWEVLLRAEDNPALHLMRTKIQMLFPYWSTERPSQAKAAFVPSVCIGHGLSKASGNAAAAAVLDRWRPIEISVSEIVVKQFEGGSLAGKYRLLLSHGVSDEERKERANLDEIWSAAAAGYRGYAEALALVRKLLMIEDGFGAARRSNEARLAELGPFSSDVPLDVARPSLAGGNLSLSGEAEIEVVDEEELGASSGEDGELLQEVLSLAVPHFSPRCPAAPGPRVPGAEVLGGRATTTASCSSPPRVRSRTNRTRRKRAIWTRRRLRKRSSGRGRRA